MSTRPAATDAVSLTPIALDERPDGRQLNVVQVDGGVPVIHTIPGLDIIQARASKECARHWSHCRLPPGMPERRVLAARLGGQRWREPMPPASASADDANILWDYTALLRESAPSLLSIKSNVDNCPVGAARPKSQREKRTSRSRIYRPVSVQASPGVRAFLRRRRHVSPSGSPAFLTPRVDKQNSGGSVTPTASALKSRRVSAMSLDNTHAERRPSVTFDRTSSPPTPLRTHAFAARRATGTIPALHVRIDGDEGSFLVLENCVHPLDTIDDLRRLISARSAELGGCPDVAEGRFTFAAFSAPAIDLLDSLRDSYESYFSEHDAAALLYGDAREIKAKGRNHRQQAWLVAQHVRSLRVMAERHCAVDSVLQSVALPRTRLGPPARRFFHPMEPLPIALRSPLLLPHAAVIREFAHLVSGALRVEADRRLQAASEGSDLNSVAASFGFKRRVPAPPDHCGLQPWRPSLKLAALEVIRRLRWARAVALHNAALQAASSPIHAHEPILAPFIHPRVWRLPMVVIRRHSDTTDESRLRSALAYSIVSRVTRPTSLFSELRSEADRRTGALFADPNAADKGKKGVKFSTSAKTHDAAWMTDDDIDSLRSDVRAHGPVVWRDASGLNLVHYAVLRRDPRLIEVLCSAGVPCVNASASGDTPLSLCCKAHAPSPLVLAMLQAFITHTPSAELARLLDHQDGHGATPLEILAARRDQSMIRVVCEAVNSLHGGPSLRQRRALRTHVGIEEAVAKGDLAWVQWWFEACAMSTDVVVFGASSATGQPLLSYAFSLYPTRRTDSAFLHTLSWIIARGVSPTLLDEEDRSPLHVACRVSALEFVLPIITASVTNGKSEEVRAAVGARDRCGATMLHAMLEYGSDLGLTAHAGGILAHPFVAAAIDPLAQDHHGNTLLHLALRRRSTHVTSVLSKALLYDNIQAVRALARIQNNDGDTPLGVAIRADFVAGIEYVLDRDVAADIALSAHNSLNRTALLLAVDVHVARVSFGGEQSVMNERPHCASRTTSHAIHTILRLARGHGFDLRQLLDNVSGRQLETPLHAAVRARLWHLASMLLTHHASASIADAKGTTPRRMACEDAYDSSLARLLLGNDRTGVASEEALVEVVTSGGAASCDVGLLTDLYFSRATYDLRATPLGRTILLSAARDCNVRLLVFVLEHGAREGATPSEAGVLAVFLRSLRLRRKKRPAFPRFVDSAEGERAAEELCMQFLRLGFFIDPSCLFDAVECGFAKVSHELLSVGRNPPTAVEYVDPERGDTPLIAATRRARRDDGGSWTTVVFALCDRTEDCAKANASDETALSIAVRDNMPLIAVRLLLTGCFYSAPQRQVVFATNGAMPPGAWLACAWLKPRLRWRRAAVVADAVCAGRMDIVRLFAQASLRTRRHSFAELLMAPFEGLPSAVSATPRLDCVMSYAAGHAPRLCLESLLGMLPEDGSLGGLRYGALRAALMEAFAFGRVSNAELLATRIAFLEPVIDDTFAPFCRFDSVLAAAAASPNKSYRLFNVFASILASYIDKDPSAALPPTDNRALDGPLVLEALSAFETKAVPEVVMNLLRSLRGVTVLADPEDDDDVSDREDMLALCRGATSTESSSAKPRPKDPLPSSLLVRRTVTDFIVRVLLRLRPRESIVPIMRDAASDVRAFEGDIEHPTDFFLNASAVRESRLDLEQHTDYMFRNVAVADDAQSDVPSGQQFQIAVNAQSEQAGADDGSPLDLRKYNDNGDTLFDRKKTPTESNSTNTGDEERGRFTRNHPYPHNPTRRPSEAVPLHMARLEPIHNAFVEAFPMEALELLFRHRCVLSLTHIMEHIDLFPKIAGRISQFVLSDGSRLLNAVMVLPVPDAAVKKAIDCAREEASDARQHAGWWTELLLDVRHADLIKRIPATTRSAFPALSALRDMARSDPTTMPSLAPREDTPLHSAVRSGRAEVVAHILQAANVEVDVNAKNADGRTALALAAALGETECASLLVSTGVDVLVEDKRGLTALHLAAAAGATSIVELILADDDGPEAASTCSSKPYASYPVMKALQSGRDDCACELLTSHACENTPKEITIVTTGETLLHYAALTNCTMSMDLLLARSSPEFACKVSHDGYTCRDYATPDSGMDATLRAHKIPRRITRDLLADWSVAEAFIPRHIASHAVRGLQEADQKLLLRLRPDARPYSLSRQAFEAAKCGDERRLLDILRLGATDRVRIRVYNIPSVGTSEKLRSAVAKDIILALSKYGGVKGPVEFPVVTSAPTERLSIATLVARRRTTINASQAVDFPPGEPYALICSADERFIEVLLATQDVVARRKVLVFMRDEPRGPNVRLCPDGGDHRTALHYMCRNGLAEALQWTIDANATAGVLSREVTKDLSQRADSAGLSPYHHAVLQKQWGCVAALLAAQVPSVASNQFPPPLHCFTSSADVHDLTRCAPRALWNPAKARVLNWTTEGANPWDARGDATEDGGALFYARRCGDPKVTRAILGTSLEATMPERIEEVKRRLVRELLPLAALQHPHLNGLLIPVEDAITSLRITIDPDAFDARDSVPERERFKAFAIHHLAGGTLYRQLYEIYDRLLGGECGIFGWICATKISSISIQPQSSSASMGNAAATVVRRLPEAARAVIAAKIAQRRERADSDSDYDIESVMGTDGAALSRLRRRSRKSTSEGVLSAFGSVDVAIPLYVSQGTLVIPSASEAIEDFFSIPAVNAAQEVLRTVAEIEQSIGSTVSLVVCDRFCAIIHRLLAAMVAGRYVATGDDDPLEYADTIAAELNVAIAKTQGLTVADVVRRVSSVDQALRFVKKNVLLPAPHNFSATTSFANGTGGFFVHLARGPCVHASGLRSHLKLVFSFSTMRQEVFDTQLLKGVGMGWEGVGASQRVAIPSSLEGRGTSVLQYKLPVLVLGAALDSGSGHVQHGQLGTFCGTSWRQRQFQLYEWSLGCAGRPNIAHVLRAPVRAYQRLKRPVASLPTQAVSPADVALSMARGAPVGAVPWGGDACVEAIQAALGLLTQRIAPSGSDDISSTTQARSRRGTAKGARSIDWSVVIAGIFAASLDLPMLASMACVSRQLRQTVFTFASTHAEPLLTQWAQSQGAMVDAVMSKARRDLEARDNAGFMTVPVGARRAVARRLLANTLIPGQSRKNSRHTTHPVDAAYRLFLRHPFRIFLILRTRRTWQCPDAPFSPSVYMQAIHQYFTAAEGALIAAGAARRWTRIVGQSKVDEDVDEVAGWS